MNMSILAFAMSRRTVAYNEIIIYLLTGSVPLTCIVLVAHTHTHTRRVTLPLYFRRNAFDVPVHLLSQIRFSLAEHSANV